MPHPNRSNTKNFADQRKPPDFWAEVTFWPWKKRVLALEKRFIALEFPWKSIGGLGGGGGGGGVPWKVSEHLLGTGPRESKYSPWKKVLAVLLGEYEAVKDRVLALEKSFYRPGISLEDYLRGGGGGGGH